jgi:membrane protein DedA with SNARE-associated domain
MHFVLLQGLLGLIFGSASAIISQYGYLAVFFLMVLEAASLPVPSEAVLPLVGYLGATGRMNVAYGFAAAMAGGIVGMTLDYYIAYFLGKDVVYKHLHLFHIKRASIEAFDSWFEKNGRFTVFVSRLIPLVRGLINFPAGFAAMPLRRFYVYSIAGTLIWTVVLVAFGYYALSTSSLVMLVTALALFMILLYVVYRLAAGRIISGARKQ